jgi:hypothetical protein
MGERLMPVPMIHNDVVAERLTGRMRLQPRRACFGGPDYRLLVEIERQIKTSQGLRVLRTSWVPAWREIEANDLQGRHLMLAQSSTLGEVR